MRGPILCQFPPMPFRGHLPSFGARQFGCGFPDSSFGDFGHGHQRSEHGCWCRDHSGRDGHEDHCRGHGGPRRGPHRPHFGPRGHHFGPHRPHFGPHAPHFGPPRHGPPHHGPHDGPHHGPHDDSHTCGHQHDKPSSPREESHDPRTENTGPFFPFEFFAMGRPGARDRIRSLRGSQRFFGAFGRPAPYGFNRHCCGRCGPSNNCREDVGTERPCEKPNSDRCERKKDKGCRNKQKNPANADADTETVFVQNILVETAPRSNSV